MNSLLTQAIVGWVLIYIVLMIVLDGYAFLKWLIGLLVMTVQWSLQASYRCFLRFLIWSLGQLRKGGLKVSGLCRSWWPVMFQASMTYMKLVWYYLIKGRKEFASFADYLKDWSEFRQDQDNGQSDAKDFRQPPGSAYVQALEILGLADQPDFTLADLKNQLRKLRAIVHPDKGFPNRVFFQQIHDAFAIVKQERNWS